MENAIRLIIVKSPAAAGAAMKTLQAIRAKSPAVSTRYAQTVESALSDPQANFTPEERETLLENISSVDTRDFMLRVRLTEEERQAIQMAADAARQTISDYVRSKLFEQD
jgi:hypothetical protein